MIFSNDLEDVREYLFLLHFSGAWRQAQLAKEERVRAIQELEAVEKRAKEIEDRARDMSTEFARERKRNAAEAEERIREMER